MRSYGAQILLAFAVFPLAALVTLLPWLLLRRRRGERTAPGAVLLACVLVIYLTGVVFLVLLPIPSFGDGYCARYAARVQLNPFQFFTDMRMIQGRGGPLLLGNQAFEVRAFNVLLFVPFGMLIRHLCHRGVLLTAVLGLLASLTIELVQLTAVFGLFPCPWRTFDVDDLIANTAGALLGALAAPLLRLIPGQRGAEGLPVARLTGDGFQVSQQQLAVRVFGDVLRGGQRLVGVSPGPARVPRDGAGTGKRLVGKGEIPVLDAVLLAQVQHPASVVQRRLGPAEHRVHPGDLPFTASEVCRGRRRNLTPVIAGGMRGVNHAVIVLPGPVLLLHQPPGLVEQLGGQQPRIGDAAGARRTLGGRRAARPILLGHGSS
jgi:glycopeptide antibiotics resistance protein